MPPGCTSANADQQASRSRRTYTTDGVSSAQTSSPLSSPPQRKEKAPPQGITRHRRGMPCCFGAILSFGGMSVSHDSASIVSIHGRDCNKKKRAPLTERGRLGAPWARTAMQRQRHGRELWFCAVIIQTSANRQPSSGSSSSFASPASYTMTGSILTMSRLSFGPDFHTIET